jgi:SAM-dependent methyltransferase
MGESNGTGHHGPDRRSDCLICGSHRLKYLFLSHGYRVDQCLTCGLRFLNPQPSDEVLAGIYSEHYALGDPSPEGMRRVAGMKRATASLYLQQLLDFTGSPPATLLEVGCGSGDLLVEAQAAGIDVTGVEVSAHAASTANERLGKPAVRHGELADVDLPARSFDACVLSDVIEHDRDPVRLLERVRELLAPGGALFIATVSTQHWTARAMGRHWMEHKIEHLTYFDPMSITLALTKAGFRDVAIVPNVKVLTPEYVYHHFERFRVPLVSSAVELAFRALPRTAQRHRFKIVASGMTALARAGA